MDFKTGIGFDIHRLVEGRKLVLGGVEIPHDKGLDGHSDADVLLHAVCDAILGALGKGDIGEHFPNTDERFKDISSLELLSKVVALMTAQGFALGNLDVMLIAEAPKIGPYKEQMCEHIAKCIGVDPSSINIKATTNEGLGFIGAGEGMSAYATALIVKR